MEFDIDGGHALRDRNVEGIDIQRVALPLECLAVGAEPYAGCVLDVAARTVAARDPLRIQHDEIALVCDGDLLMDVEDAARYVGCVHRQLDGARKGEVLCNRDTDRLRISLGLAVERRKVEFSFVNQPEPLMRCTGDPIIA